jgi:hypothetical protein
MYRIQTTDELLQSECAHKKLYIVLEYVYRCFAESVSFVNCLAQSFPQANLVSSVGPTIAIKLSFGTVRLIRWIVAQS